MKRLIVIILVSLLATSALANDPKRDYKDQPKYAKIFCGLAGIPPQYSRGKKP